MSKDKSKGASDLIYKDYLFRERIPLLNRALDAYAMRQRVIAQNIANVSTPHYAPKRVKFEELFRENQNLIKVQRTNPREIPIGRKDPSEIAPEKTTPLVPRPDVYFSGESHVNIDKEMSELAQNQIRFRFASKAMKNYFQRLQTAIREAIR